LGEEDGQERGGDLLLAQQRLRALVLDTLTSPHSRRNYGKALDDLFAFAAGRPLTRVLLLEYRASLDRLSASTINVRLSAIRKLVGEARRLGLVGVEEATNLTDMPNIRQKGTRLGNWLTREQAKELLAVPDRSSLKGKRDYVILALLVGCALRRTELAELEVDETAHSIKTGQSRVAEVSRKRTSVCDIFCEAPGRHPMKIGYARVSTEDQRLTLQLEALKQAGCSKVFREKVSGAYRDRPELNRMIDQLRNDDVVTVWKLDRLARSTRNLLEIVEAISQAGARFQSISEPWADTTTHAEFERDLIRERTGAGRADAQKRGVRFGRPKKMNEDQRKLAQRLLKEGKSVREVARTFGVHLATLYRIVAPSP
jgi:DNA invertase Pin-like site-specific DNA recombinase